MLMLELDNSKEPESLKPDFVAFPKRKFQILLSSIPYSKVESNWNQIKIYLNLIFWVFLKTETFNRMKC